MKEIDDRIARMGFLEEVALKFERLGRELAESEAEYVPLYPFNAEETLGEQHSHACVNYLHAKAYAKRKARIARMKCESA